MSAFLIIIIILILIVAISLIVILLNMNSGNKNVNKKKKIEKNIPSVLVVKNIVLPMKISQMDYFTLSKAGNQVFESFKALDYVNKPSSKLDKVEWHTWQVSLLMAILKANNGFFIPNDDSLFHKVILSSNKDSIVQSTQKIINKYNNTIDINKSRDELSHDIVWSSKEVSILFYYMSKY